MYTQANKMSSAWTFHSSPLKTFTTLWVQPASFLSVAAFIINNPMNPINRINPICLNSFTIKSRSAQTHLRKIWDFSKPHPWGMWCKCSSSQFQMANHRDWGIVGYNDGDHKIWRTRSFSSDWIDLVCQIWSVGLLTMNTTSVTKYLFWSTKNTLQRSYHRRTLHVTYLCTQISFADREANPVHTCHPRGFGGRKLYPRGPGNPRGNQHWRKIARESPLYSSSFNKCHI